MSLTFDPERFPDRVIFIDTTAVPPVQMMGCLGCGRMADALFKNFELCEPCYRQWSIEFCKEWLGVRFGSRACGADRADDVSPFRGSDAGKL